MDIRKESKVSIRSYITIERKYGKLVKKERKCREDIKETVNINRIE